jgi:hypothetical protein
MSIVYGESNNIDVLRQKAGNITLNSKNVTSRNDKNVGAVDDKLSISAVRLFHL